MLLKKLVIAEDDDAVAHLVAASLGDAGFLCLRARDGEEALTLVRRELPDALVLDVMMPRMDGIEVCRRLKGDVLLSRVPILMLTSLAGVDDRVAGLESGADDYLPKPFDLRELAARVRALIRQCRRERDRNPVTNLPGNEAIEDHVSELLSQNTSFSLLYIDVENFRTYADVYGYRRAEDVVQHTGKQILQYCREASEIPPFLGHLGGDDFIVVGQDAALKNIGLELVPAFAEQVESFYTEGDRSRGSTQLMDEDGSVRREAQFMSLSIAVVEVPAGKFSTTEELAADVTRAKVAARKNTGSGLIHIPSSTISE
jgi:DNA-binding response OmpR family regulator